MKQLKQKIEERKHSINQKKKYLAHDYATLKRKLGSTKSLSLATLGGLIVGLLFVPKKYRLIKSVFKAYSMTATLRALLEDRQINKKTFK